MPALTPAVSLGSVGLDERRFVQLGPPFPSPRRFQLGDGRIVVRAGYRIALRAFQVGQDFGSAPYLSRLALSGILGDWASSWPVLEARGVGLSDEASAFPTSSRSLSLTASRVSDRVSDKVGPMERFRLAFREQLLPRPKQVRRRLPDDGVVNFIFGSSSIVNYLCRMLCVMRVSWCQFSLTRRRPGAIVEGGISSQSSYFRERGVSAHGI